MTYTGLLDPIRKAFAKAKTSAAKPEDLQRELQGACPNCNGAGVIYTDLAMMAGVAAPCGVCDGKRFDASVLEYTFGEKDISEVLAMAVNEAVEFFGDGPAKVAAAHTILERLADVGLGYLSLGQPLTTLSGGERQQRVWPLTWAKKDRSMCLMSRPRACTWPTLSSCSDCWTGSSMPASRSSSSRTTAVMTHADWIVDLRARRRARRR